MGTIVYELEIIFASGASCCATFRTHHEAAQFAAEQRKGGNVAEVVAQRVTRETIAI
jgi:hypothetical protein